MKLIVTGATGFVGGEVVRLALQDKSISSVVALTRKAVPVPKHVGPEADTSKLKSVILEDWENPYPDDVVEQLKGADGCVWFVNPLLSCPVIVSAHALAGPSQSPPPSPKKRASTR